VLFEIISFEEKEGVYSLNCFRDLMKKMKGRQGREERVYDL
jgi:hypothetical protein